MTEFVALRPKTYSCLTDDCKDDKKAKGTKKCVIKRRLKFNDYRDCLQNNEIVLKSQQRIKSGRYDVYTEEFNKIENTAIKQSKYKMINFDNYTNGNKTEHNLKWPYIPDHP